MVPGRCLAAKKPGRGAALPGVRKDKLLQWPAADLTPGARAAGNRKKRSPELFGARVPKHGKVKSKGTGRKTDRQAHPWPVHHIAGKGHSRKSPSGNHQPFRIDSEVQGFLADTLPSF